MGSTTLVHPPTNSPGWDTADELIRWAIHLEDELRARLGHDDRTRAKRRDLGSAVRYLATYSTALLSGLDAEKVGRQIMGRKRDLEQRTGRDRLIHRLPGTCLVCDRKGLQRRDGGDLVRCRSCGATWAWEQYELLARAYADDVRRRGA
jgi:ribosomal protein L37AE/L43A